MLIAMKTFTILALLVTTTLINAQSPDDYRAKMNSVFSNLNTADISTGYCTSSNESGQKG